MHGDPDVVIQLFLHIMTLTVCICMLLHSGLGKMVRSVLLSPMKTPVIALRCAVN